MVELAPALVSAGTVHEKKNALEKETMRQIGTQTAGKTDVESCRQSEDRKREEGDGVRGLQRGERTEARSLSDTGVLEFRIPVRQSGCLIFQEIE